MTTVSKIDLILVFLATSIYRPWYWQHYAKAKEQAVLRKSWLPVACRFTPSEIRNGLNRWAIERGVCNPPDPEAFAEFIAPVPTVQSQRFFSNARSILGDSANGHR